MKQVVTMAFIKERKLLVVKSVRSARQNMYTLIGGLVEDNETLMEACIREAKEEINKDLIIHAHDLEEIATFVEGAASDASMIIEIHLFICKKELDIELIPDLEILEYKYIDSMTEDIILSSSITDYFLPYAKKWDLID